jgi:hypothetical protein
LTPILYPGPHAYLRTHSAIGWTLKFGMIFLIFPEKSSADLEKRPDYPEPGAPIAFRSYLSMNFWLYRE